MSDLMSNPTSEPDLEAAESEDRAADTGLADPARGRVVVRYHANADSSGHPENFEDDNHVGEPRTTSEPDHGSIASRQWVRALVGVMARSLGAIGRTGIRGAVRYPRTSAWTGLSILILGAILLTRPTKPTPLAQVPSSPAAPLPGEKKAPEDEVGPKAVVGAERQNESPTEKKVTEKKPAPATQAPATAPPRMPGQGDANLLARTFQTPAPAPLPSPISSPTQAGSAPHPDTSTPTLPDPGPELPPTNRSSVEALLDSGPDLPPVPSAADRSPALTPVDLVPLPTGKDVTLTGGSDGVDPQTTPATPQGTVERSQPNAPAPTREQPKADLPPKPTSPSPDPPKPDSTPKPEPTKPDPPKPDSTPKPEPTKPDPPKPDSTPKPEPTKPDPPKPADPSPAPGQSGPIPSPAPFKLESPVPTPETPKPEQPEQQQAPAIQDLKAETKTPKPDSNPRPENPEPPPQISRPDNPEPQTARGVDTPKPRMLEPGVLTPGPEATPPRSQAPMDRPEAQATRSEATAPSAKEAPNQPGMSTSAPVSEVSGPGTEDAAARKETAVARPDESTPAAPHSSTNPIPDQAVAGWVRLPNTGKISEVLGERSDALGEVAGSAAERRRDLRAHADKDVSFEAESARYAPRILSSGTADGSGVRSAPRPSGIESPSRGSRLPNQLGSEVESPRVEAVPHIVERDENFWTISRLYYSSGRYYRALWKANAQKYPNIQTLHVKDVIMIPPVEDLDPAYIDPPSSRTALAGIDKTGRSRRAESSTESPSPPVGRRESLQTARTTRASTSASTNTIPAVRSNRTDAVLNLPIGEIALPRDRGDRTDEKAIDDGSEYRVTARPRISAPINRPIYKVHRYDTLRSIARDTLGDPRRASEILALNRDIIDDPAHLISGQLLELPEDADTRRGGY
jgi:nucleoid-associated protein YgaU